MSAPNKETQAAMREADAIVAARRGAKPDAVRAEVLRAIDATTMHVGSLTCGEAWRLRSALAFLSGYLRDAEPEMADRLVKLLRVAEA